MAHVRTQIRNLVKSALKTAFPSYSIFSSRKYAINSDELPVIDMKFLNENSETISMDNLHQNTASLYIRTTIAAASENLDDDLDSISVLLDAAMDGAGLDNIVKHWDLVQTNFTDSADGVKPLAEIVMRYDMVYHTRGGNSEVAIT